MEPKDADEGRPYEFGFTIDGEQHRHEKKGNSKVEFLIKKINIFE